jgi:hypothetical protein
MAKRAARHGPARPNAHNSGPDTTREPVDRVGPTYYAGCEGQQTLSEAA